MKKIQVILLFAVFINTTIAQNPNTDYKAAIKVYNLTSFENSNPVLWQIAGTKNYYYTTNSYIRILHPTVAVQWKTKKNNFREIEIIDMMLAKNTGTTEIRNDSSHTRQIVSGAKLYSTAISFRYEYTRVFNKSKDKKFVPSLGVGINPFFTKSKTDPQVSSNFATAQVDFGIKTFIIPRITYYMNKKLFLDLNFPLSIATGTFHNQTDSNPAIPKPQQTISLIDFNMFSNIFSCRIGLGIKL